MGRSGGVEMKGDEGRERGEEERERGKGAAGRDGGAHAILNGSGATSANGRIDVKGSLVFGIGICES